MHKKKERNNVYTYVYTYMHKITRIMYACVLSFFRLLHTRIYIHSQIIILSSKCRLQQHSTNIHAYIGMRFFSFASRFRVRTTFNKIVHIVRVCVNILTKSIILVIFWGWICIYKNRKANFFEQMISYLVLYIRLTSLYFIHLDKVIRYVNIK